MKDRPLRVLGIDPGSARTGFGLVDLARHELSAVDFGCIETSPAWSTAERLRQLHTQLEGVLRQHRPDAVAVEQVFFARNVTTVIGVAQARGVALLAAAQASVPVAEYTPLQVKVSVVGYGKAQKAQVQHMVAILLRLPAPPEPDDTADALAVAICHCHRGGEVRGAADGRAGTGRPPSRSASPNTRTPRSLPRAPTMGDVGQPTDGASVLP